MAGLVRKRCIVKEKLPIWFQCMVIVCLSGIWMAAIAWVGRHDYALIKIRGSEWTVATVLYLYIPLPIVILGARFCWRFTLLDGLAKNTRAETLFYSIGLLLTLAILCLMLFLPAVQRVREASSYFAQASHLP